MGRKAKLSLRYKLLLYKALLRPVISYTSPVWGAAAKTHIQTLETLQNSTLRMITDAPWFIRNKNILHNLKVPTIKDFFSKLATNFFNQIDNHTNPAIRCLSPRTILRFPGKSEDLALFSCRTTVGSSESSIQNSRPTRVATTS
ncbi:hypothetical protein AVEN_143539-1 [Araneus ventricosus]|uniref:RNA-directed DNA polymerase from transposon X-element n=1 Tax=Araneus ventricosus TaxID=182803 RepID=A0A4Y2AN21_ARAVE|nr:hypothetical protein AVEN_143539-1 [Araneus ventricosus]